MKKMKKLTSIGAIGVVPLVATAVAPALVLSSCGSSKQDQNISPDLNYDDENNFDARWFDQFVESYKGAIYTQVIYPSSEGEQWKKLQIENLEKSVENFREQLEQLLNDESSRPFAYSAISNAMIDNAYDSYVDAQGKKIKLDIRHSNKTFDDIVDMFNQQKRSAESLMESTGVSKKNRDLILANAQQTFDELFAQLKDRYADPLSAYIKAQSKLNFIFSEVSDEIALAGASDALSEFLNNYQFEYKNVDESNRLDNLLGQTIHDEDDHVDVTFAENNDISAFMPTIFTIRNLATGQLVENFKKYEVIPGYKVVPYLKKINKDYHSNNFSIEIDWRVVKQSFIGKKNEKLVTAHIMNPDQNGDLLKKSYDTKTFTLEELVSEDNVANLVYPVEITLETQRKALENIYFGGTNEIADPDFAKEWEEEGEHEKIEFRFDTSTANKLSELAYDPFLDGGLKAKTSNEDDDIDHVEIDTAQLARVGLEVKVTNTKTNEETEWTRLDKILGFKKEEPTQSNEEEEIVRPAIVEDFLNNCSLAADCKLHTTADDRQVDYKIFAVYGNTARKTLKEADTTSARVYPCGEEKTLRNLPLTKGLYWSMTNRYNAVRSYVETYKDNPYAERMAAADKEKSSRIAVLSVTSILSAACAALNFVPFLKPSSRVVLAAFCVLSACEIAVAGTSYGLWKKHCYETIKDYYERAQTFSGSKICEDTFYSIKTDGDNYNLLSGENKNGDVYIEKELYEQNYIENFTGDKAANLKELAKFSRNYSNVNEYPGMSQFNAELEKADIDLVDYNLENDSELNQWKENIEVLDALSWSIFGAEMLCMVVDIGVSIYAAHQAKMAAMIAEGKIIKVSGTIEKRLTDAGRKIYKIKGESYANFDDYLSFICPIPELPVQSWAYRAWKDPKTGEIVWLERPFQGKEGLEEALNSMAVMLRDADKGIQNADISWAESGAWEKLKQALLENVSQNGVVVGSGAGIAKIYGNQYKGLARFYGEGGKGGIFEAFERLFAAESTAQGPKLANFVSKDLLNVLQRRFAKRFLKQWAKKTRIREFEVAIKEVLRDKVMWGSRPTDEIFWNIDRLFDYVYRPRDIGIMTHLTSEVELQIISQAFVDSMERMFQGLFSTENAFAKIVHLL